MTQMIHKDTYSYLINHTSGVEFDVLLYSILNTDWEGVIQCSPGQLAAQVGTKEKYVRYILNKYTNRTARQIFTPVQTANGLRYRLNLGIPGYVKFNKKTASYCKKYSFFYTKAFRKLPINAKRLLLMAAFRMSTNKAEKVRFEYNEIVPSTMKGGHYCFNRQRMVEAIYAIQQSELCEVVSVYFASNLTTQEAEIRFSFQEGTLDKYESNHTERRMLRSVVYKAGYLEWLPDAVCIEIEKVGKHIFRSLAEGLKSHSKETRVVSNASEDVLGLARFAYRRSLEKLGKVFNSNKNLLAEPKQASAYFSSIVNEILLDESGKYNHQVESIRSLLDFPVVSQKEIEELRERKIDGYKLHNDVLKERFEKALTIATVVANWCEQWVVSRVNSVKEDVATITNNPTGEAAAKVQAKRGWKNFKEEALKYIEGLKLETYHNLEQLSATIERLGNKRVDEQDRLSFVKQHKEKLSSFFSIQKDRIEMITEVEMAS